MRFPDRFHGQVALVTGAGGTGTGGTLVRRFLDEGASVVAADIDGAGLKALMDSVPTGARPQLRTCQADAGIDENANELVDLAIAEFGRLDVVCNHAGGGIPGGRVVGLSLEAWDQQLRNTLTSVFLVSKRALPHLVHSQGCIVNTASISGLGGDWGMASYNAAKGGVINLTRSMAVEYGEAGVRVNAVAPGAIIYPARQEFFGSIAEDYLPRVPLRRYATPEDIAAAITFLASADASYINGHVLTVDGGITADNGQLNFVKRFQPEGQA